MAKDKVVPAKPAKDKDAPVPPARKDQESKASATHKIDLQETLRSRPQSIKVLSIVFAVLAVITLLVCLGAIGLSIMSAVTTKAFTSGQSGRVVGQVILTVTAAITLAIVIYSGIGLYKKKVQPLYITLAVLIILAIIQAIILGVAVSVNNTEIETISLNMLESFQAAQAGDLKKMKQWDTTQYSFKCCGIFSPADYRSLNLPGYFPPNVPVSCCPGYDPNRPNIVQNTELQLCKAKKEYYAEGCRNDIISSVVGVALLVIIWVSTLIVLEVLLAVISGLIIRKLKQNS